MRASLARMGRTPHNGGDEAINLSETPGIPHTRRHLVSKRDQSRYDLSSFSVSLNVASTATSSSHQQDLPDTTLFSLCLSLGRFIEWQFLADWDYQLAIPHRLGHGFERFPIKFREYVRHSYRWVLCGVLRCFDNRCVHPSRLDLGDQFLGGSSADCIGNRIERRKTVQSRCRRQLETT